MKNIEQILKDAGLEATDEQRTAINAAVGENYKPIADYEKQVKKAEKAEGDRDAYKGQLEAANKTLEGFKDIDPEKIKGEIEAYKGEAKKAREEADRQILQRDQRDCLKAEFARLGISSERTQKSLMADIMGEDGLKWKDGAFIGLSDYLAKENEKDHFYQTDQEKADAEAAKKAAEGAPKFTAQSEGKKEPPAESKPVPKIW